MKHIGEDFQGWPVDAMTLEEILRYLGFKENKGSWSISKKSPILKAYPMLLEDDGMGYGVKPEFVTEADSDIYETEIMAFNYEVAKMPDEKGIYDVKRVYSKEKINVFNLFREPPHHKVGEDDK